MNWRDQGLCAEVDPELWFPEKGGSAAPAKRICRQCPVRAECLAYALDNHEWWGVWGGLTYRERLAIQDGAPAPVPLPAASCAATTPRRNLGSQGCGTAAGYQRHWRLGETSCDACREAAARARAALKEAS